ncbi:MAG: nickel-dependent hydrogenase large subunit [Methanosarcinaceae archaeon]|nr:nickel-dependent hydrogenase large subunit [Methanosarcinaceae archaeon]
MVRVTIDQLTRIEGHYRIDTEVNEAGVITEARSMGLMPRGFERFLEKQDPRDAALLTQRICGVCPTSHSIAAAEALDQLFGVEASVPKDALVMRNIHQSLNMMTSHLTHVYVLWAPDLVNPAYRKLLGKYGGLGTSVWKELLKRYAPISYRIEGVDIPPGEAYIRAIREKRRLHEAISLMGAKMPHSVMAHVGGVTYGATLADLGQLAAYYWKTMDFVEKYTLGGLSPKLWLENTYLARSSQKALAFVLERLQEITEASLISNDFSYEAGWGDLPLFAAFGSELLGEETLALPLSLKFDRTGGYGEPEKIGFLSYGAYYKPELGDGYEPESPHGARVFPSGFLNGKFEFEAFDYTKILESNTHTFYVDSEANRKPFEGSTEPEPDPSKINFDALQAPYSWIKAPSYGGLPCEVGPLSRLLIQGEPLISGLLEFFREKGYPAPNNYLRMLARFQETLILGALFFKWISEDLDPKGKFAVPTNLSMAKNSEGMGLWEAPRGALGHWIKTGSDSKVTLYQAVVASTWNLAPKNATGIPGPVEQALLGTKISAAENALGIDYTNPLGILHTVRAYDPCLACAIHAVDRTGKHKEWKKVI